MKIDYIDPQKKEGVFVWEADVLFFPRRSSDEFSGKSEQDVCQELKWKYGESSLCFPSMRREDAFLVWVAKIGEWDSQKETKVSFNIPERKSYQDPESGNTISVFDFSREVTGRKQLKENFSFSSYKAKIAPDGREVEEYDTGSSLYRKYTKSESRIGKTESIVELAREVSAKEDDSLGKAKRLYEWVTENVARRKGVGKRKITRVFEEREGTPEEVSLLLVVLLRAIGIPARLVSGAQGERRQELHSWAEFYVENDGWVPVDCAKGLFGEIDSQRVIFSKGENILLERAPENSVVFDIRYKRALSLCPEAVYIDSKEEGFFVVRKSKYLVLKDSTDK